MANTWSWATLVTAVVPAVIPVVLTFILTRLSQRELHRLQLEAETQIKRLDAVEKAMSLAEKAKVSTHELQNELKRILHEFEGPVVRSREALEDWANEALVGKFILTPRFSEPRKKARLVRGMRISSFIAIFAFLLYGTYGTLITLSPIPLNGSLWKFILFYCVLWGLLYLSLRVFIFRESKSALKALRVMPENSAEVNIPVLADAAPELQPLTNRSPSMSLSQIAELLIALALLVGGVWLYNRDEPARAQTVPQPPQQSTPQSLANESQHDISTAQLLYQLGQLKAQLGTALEQATAKDAYWKDYVAGEQQHPTTGGK